MRGGWPKTRPALNGRRGSSGAEGLRIGSLSSLLLDYGLFQFGLSGFSAKNAAGIDKSWCSANPQLMSEINVGLDACGDSITE